MAASITAAAAGWADVLVLNPATDPAGTTTCASSFASGSGFNGTPANLRHTIDLIAYANKRIQFRFYFDTRDGQYQADDGWSINNVDVLGREGNKIFSSKAEDDAQPWVVANSSGTAPGWQRYTDSATATNWWRYFNPTYNTYQKFTGTGCSEAESTYGTLTSPEITLDGSSKLAFDTIWKIEGVNPASFDLMRVQVLLTDLTATAQGPTYVTTGGTASYTVTVANVSVVTAANVGVSGTLASSPAGAAITSAVASNGAPCDVGVGGTTFGCGGAFSLTGVQSMQITLSATAPTTSGSMTLTANATTATAEASTTNNSSVATSSVVKGIVGIVRCPPPTIGTSWLVELFSGGTRVASTTSHAVTGEYLFVDVGAGTFEVRASKTGVTCTTSVTVSASGVGIAGTTVQVKDLANHSWRTAYQIPLNTVLGKSPTGALALKGTVEEHLFKPHQSLWFRVPVNVGDKLKLLVTGCTFNCDMILYRNPQIALSRSITTLKDLQRTSLEMSPEDFSPEDFSPEDFSPEDFSPEDFSPEDFSPEDFSPEDFSPEDFSPEDFSPEDFSADQASPGEIVPADANTNALRRSLLAMSLREGTSSEYLVGRIWSPIDYVYVRIRARSGESSAVDPIQLKAISIPGNCSTVGAVTGLAGGATLIAPATAPSLVKTVIVTDLSSLPGDATGLRSALATFVGRPEVAGVALDISTAPRVAAAKTQAAANLQCPYAKNLVATEIKALIDAYPRPTATTGGLEYVVLVGGDPVIPFFREIDTASIAGERLWGGPPYGDDTASQAAIRRGYVLSQLRYGAVAELTVKHRSVPIADVAVGRLVETATEAAGMLQAYLGIPGGNGTYAVTTRPLVTGYGNMLDGSQEIAAELGLGTGYVPDTLYHAGLPTDPGAWTADNLRAKLFGGRHDVTFLAWHASQAAGLAADYKTRLPCSEIAASAVDMKNTVTFAQACHYGTNAPDGDILSVTPSPDCPQAYARKQATLITGTAFQYFDTDIVDFGERAYREFAHQLRDTSRPSVGRALTRAMTTYIANSPLGGTHEKQYLETVLYGVPQLTLTLTGMLSSSTDPSVVTATAPVTDPTGATVSGLGRFDLDRSFTLTPKVASGRSYLTAEDGTYGEGLQPVQPYDTVNVTVPDYALRGVVLLEGAFGDSAVTPLLKAPASELSSTQVTFSSSVAYPVLPFRLNPVEALVGLNPTTHIGFTPAQHWTVGPQTLRRAFTSEKVALLYSNVTGTGAADGAPAITEVQTASLSPTSASVTVHITSAAQVVKVWITYYTVGGTQLRSFELTRSTTDTSTWSGDKEFAPTTLSGVRFIVQAVNAVGVVGRATNNGAYYVPAQPQPSTLHPRQSTAVAVTLSPGAGAYGQIITLGAKLTSGTTALVGQVLSFRIGRDRVDATTNSTGDASASLRLTTVPGTYTLAVSFNQTADYLAASAGVPFRVNKAGANLSITSSLYTPRGTDVLATSRLTGDSGVGLDQRPVVFAADAIGGFGSAIHLEALDQTGFDGQATFLAGSLQPEIYRVTARFGVALTLAGQTTVTDLTDRFYAGATTTTEVAVADPARVVGAAGAMNVPASCAPPSVDGTCSVGFTPGARARIALDGYYRSGATKPSGGIVFQVPSANFELTSAQHDWVVVAGKRAIVQGSATVNGQTGWRYRVIAVDLVPGTNNDSFEIRIWNPSHATQNSLTDPQYKLGAVADPSIVYIR